MSGARVFIALKRTIGYEDVHGDLVAEDAMSPIWPWEIVRDDGSEVIVALDRPEGYETSAPNAVAREAIRTSWTAWSIVTAV